MASGAMAVTASHAGGLLVRIDPADRASHLADPHAAPMAMSGRTMSGFIHIAPSGLASDAALHRWLAIGLAAAARPAGPRKRR